MHLVDLNYFLDFESKSTDEGFKQICSDIEKFSQDFSKKYDQIEKSFTDQNIDKTTEPTITHDKGEDEDDSNFSSDSLEDYSFFSYGAKKSRKTVPPRRCVSNNEIYKYQEEYIEDIPKSESFYLNQHYSMQGSQESILSDENNLDYNDFYSGQTKSCCNSLESVLSNESDCKSAPLEILFGDKRKQPSAEASLNMPHSQSLPKNISSQIDCELSSSLPKNFVDHSYISSGICDDKKVCNNDKLKFPPNQNAISKPDRARSNMKTCQTQTDFETPQEIVAKKGRGSEDFQKKLLKFESTIAQGSGKKPVAFFVETSTTKFRTTAKQSKENVPVKQAKAQKVKADNTEMFIPSLAQKNRQYKSRFCNVLNNKPDQNLEIFEERAHGNKNNGKSFTLSTINFEKNTNRNNIQETSSLDRHLFAKGLLNNSEKITHKPPKAVRRHSSKMRKKTTYEYIRKEDFYKKSSNGETPDGHELYDSLDKKSPPSKMDLDSLDVNLNNEGHYSSDAELNRNVFDSLEVNVWNKGACLNKNTALQVENVLKKQMHCQAETDEQLEKQGSKISPQDKIATALQNIKILNGILRKIHKINTLVDIYKKNVSRSKVKALSSMFESLTTSQSYYNDLTKLQATHIKYRRRNLSLPSFVERRLNFDRNNDNVNSKMNQNDQRDDRNKSEEYVDDTSSPESSLRRSCSLSDLSMQNVPPKRKHSEPSKKPSPPARITPRYVKNNSMMRSKSSVVLNQHSDSENDSHEKKMSRLMRPTISSHNKVIQKPLQIRNKQSYSTSK
ncbi:hypothetical protein YQE_10146, partial [Dendroctonus ponderosae]